jgi:hypothetical protein
MLQKKDLVKEFELVVKQEIKNYQDSMLATNTAINSINSRIESLKVAIEKSSNDLKNMILLEKNLCLDANKLNAKDLKDINCIIKEIIKDNKARFDEICFCIQKVESFSIKLDTIFKKMDFLLLQNDTKTKDITDLEQFFVNAINQCNRLIRKQVEGCKELIRNKPSEFDSLEQKLRTKIEDFIIDSNGIIRELRVQKKDMYVVEKNIENIYTLIERLEERIS